MSTEPRTTDPTDNEPATERYCPRCGHIDHDDRRDPRCGVITGATSEVMPEPIYCGCTDVDRLYARALAAERASGATEGLICAACGGTEPPVVHVPLHPRCAERASAGLDVERLARALEAAEQAGLVVLLGEGEPEQRSDWSATPTEVARYVVARLTGGQDDE